MYLFVYGSLKRGQGAWADLLWKQAEFAGDAAVEGTLYSLGRYAGIVDGRGRVHGELARLLTPETTLPQLDEYEGGNYERHWRPATLETGEIVPAMVYFYRGAFDSAAIIPSGRWPPPGHTR